MSYLCFCQGDGALTRHSGDKMQDLTTWTQDDIMDATVEIIDTAAKAKRRDAAMRRAHAAGHSGCEICGRAIKAKSWTVAGALIGPTCYKKLQALNW